MPAKLQTADVQITLRNYRGGDFDRLWEIDQLCFPPGIAYTQMELSGFITARNAVTLVATTSRDSAFGDSQKINGLLAGNEDSSTQSDYVAERPTCTDIAGFIVAHAIRKKYGRILTIDVAPDQRRIGIASRLIYACEERVRSVGCREMSLETAINNHAAIELYHRHGYQIVRTLRDYYASHSLDAFLMWKGL